MRVHRRIRNLTEPEKAQFEEYLQKRLEQHVEPIVKANHTDPDSVHIFADIQKHKKHTAFDFDIILEMPRKKIVAKEVKHSITEALDFATKRIEQGMIKHFKKRDKMRMAA